MHIRSWATLSVTLLVGCGGRIADDTVIGPNGVDAGGAPDVAPTVADVSPPPPPPPPPSNCTDATLDIVQSGDGCTASEKWYCGSDSYEFRCSCPATTCECWHNGMPTKLTGTLVACPSCTEADNAIAVCNFPH